MKKTTWFLFGLMAGLLPALALAEETAEKFNISLGSGDVFNKSLIALTILLVLAILLENALAVLFNWRLFLTYFSLKGIRTPIMVIVAWMVVSTFHLDIVQSLISTYQTLSPDQVKTSQTTSDTQGGTANTDTTTNTDTTKAAPADGAAAATTTSTAPENPPFITQLLTALILAGGSSGVYSLMKALGYRQEVTPDQVTPKPPKEKAWVMVRTIRSDAIGPIRVTVKKLDPMPADASSPIAGTVDNRRKPFLENFFRNPNNFPQSGGYTVDANAAYEIAAEAKGPDPAKPLVIKVSDKPLVFAPGAIVDFEVTI